MYVPRAENMADGLTKPLNGPEFHKFVGLLGMKGDGNGDEKATKENYGRQTMR